MRDLGLTANDEPATRLFTQGMVIRNGAKMSKSKGNVVSPDEMITRYGADATRMYALFAAPPDRDLEWQEDGVAGVSRFLSRVYRLTTKFAPLVKAHHSNPRIAAQTPQGQALLRKLHQTIAKITLDFSGRWHFNTCIAAIMELVNALLAAENAMELETVPEQTIAEIFRNLILLLAPFAPFLAAELWEQTGHEGSVLRKPWPEAAESDEAAVKAAALADAKVVARAEGKNMVKVIVVPRKLVNLVVK
jgi:leucyl-tRNA synthetase